MDATHSQTPGGPGSGGPGPINPALAPSQNTRFGRNPAYPLASCPDEFLRTSALNSPLLTVSVKSEPVACHARERGSGLFSERLTRQATIATPKPSPCAGARAIATSSRRQCPHTTQDRDLSLPTHVKGGSTCGGDSRGYPCSGEDSRSRPPSCASSAGDAPFG